MPKPRRKENKDLPNRWTYTHGAYYYRVPPGHEEFWNHKQIYFLGMTLETAAEAFCDVGSRVRISDGKDLYDKGLMAISSITGRSKKAPTSGVYFLIHDGEVVYVGRSDNIFARLAKHPVKFDRFHWIPATGFRQERLEQLYIASLRPRFNINVGGSSPKSMTHGRP